MVGIIVVGILLTIGSAFAFDLFEPPRQVADDQSDLARRQPATPLPTQTVTPTPVEFARSEGIVFAGATATPTLVPGGQILILSPQNQDVGWVAGNDGLVATIYDPVNHFGGESYLYTGSYDGKIYHGAFQFDLGLIPRGTKFYGASITLKGLRSDQLGDGGEWRLQLLPPEMDYRWRGLNYDQIHNAIPWLTLEPSLTQGQLGTGVLNTFEFTPEQLAHLREHHLAGTGKLSFRLDGPTEGNNLFAWDTGYARASREYGGAALPQLYLHLGPPPETTPTLVYVVITSTATPENIRTAVANSLRLTAEATQVGTVTPLPPNWVTPVVVTVTPTPENEATTQAIGELATAVAITTGQPPNIATATPTPTFVIITSTPTPENVMTAAAISLQLTAEATQVGTALPLPPNWVTPIVVTATPTPENEATAQYWLAEAAARAVAYGTPTPIPANVQTATPTGVFTPVGPMVSPTPTIAPSPIPLPVPDVLLGKIVFLSDREGPTEQERERARQRNIAPQVIPQAYFYDPKTGEMGRLADTWPYEVAVLRDAWSADKRFYIFTALAPQSGKRNGAPAVYWYDSFYEVQNQLTLFGTGIAYDGAWSPIAEQVTFVSTESGNDEVWLANRDGSGFQQLTLNEWEWDKHPSWSPDGEQIVFYSNRTGNEQIWIMNKDGSEQHLLMDWNPYNDWDPVWIKYPDAAPPLPEALLPP